MAEYVEFQIECGQQAVVITTGTGGATIFFDFSQNIDLSWMTPTERVVTAARLRAVADMIEASG